MLCQGINRAVILGCESFDEVDEMVKYLTPRDDHSSGGRDQLKLIRSLLESINSQCCNLGL